MPARQRWPSRAVTLAYLSAAADFEVSQVVDRVKGVHGLLCKADLDPLEAQR
jgi:hypothetical protein